MVPSPVLLVLLNIHSFSLPQDVSGQYIEELALELDQYRSHGGTL